MTPITDLDALIASMTPTLQPDVFVFVTVPYDTVITGTTALMVFREAEGVTLILPQNEATGLAGQFPARMITLAVNSSLEAVGFLAHVTAHLAAAGISVNPVSAFHHDHLFVPVARAEEALELLRALARSASAGIRPEFQSRQDQCD